MNLADYIKRKTPVIVEIGANIGTDTIRFAKEFPFAQIYCFEPDPQVYQELVRNTAPYKNITPFCCAIGSEDTMTTFYQSSQGLSGSIHSPKEHLSVYPSVTFSSPISVRCAKLDTFVEEARIEFIDFIWADVQGAEVDMILGGKSTFENKVKYLHTEFSKKELYEGAPGLSTILSLLPGYVLDHIVWEWEADGNALLVNTRI